jgi:protein gp37
MSNDMRGYRWLDAWDKLPAISKSARASVSNVIDGTLPNLHLGVSVENQKTADERIPLLLQTPAAVRFISAEPLLDSLNIRPYLGIECVHEDGYSEDDTNATICRECEDTQVLDWVIVGGESGAGARPMHPDWARSLRDQCKAAGVPFFFKQWGEYRVGIKASGCLLDGVEHHEFPAVTDASV